MEMKQMMKIGGLGLLVLLVLLGGQALADTKKPLLMEGKQALYQRVLAIPDARLHDQPGDEQGTAVTPFSAFYVYERKPVQGNEWLLVGVDKHGSLSGWLAAKDSISWNQGLTVVFRDPSGHDRVLMLRDKASLEALARQPGSETYRKLYEQAVQGELPADSPVVAIQPAGHIDIRKDFYLVPILDFKDTWLGTEQARMLKIASVPLASRKAAPAADGAKREYTAGLVFVIDASLSMDEYIQRTREAVMKIYDQLGDARQLGRVNFGLVAFRDNAKAAPGLDYTARTYVTLEQGRDPGVFLEKVDQLSAAKVSSKDFREDAYAGLQQAIEGMGWQGHDARYIVLITDAGAREGDDPLSTTGLGTAALRQLAQDNGIAIFVLHLKTPSENADHARAEAQYRELSDFPGIGSLYYGVPTGNVEEFGTVLDSLAGQISAQVAQGLEAQPQPARPEAKENTRLTELQLKVEKLGYALRMQYLQQFQGQPPRVFNAWMLDHDMSQPQRQTVDVRVLLTRDQLSDMHDILRQVLRTAEDGLLSPQNFINELKSLAATISRNPEELGRTTATTAGEGNSLVDMGFIGDYIEGLPYTGEVMSLSLDDWQSWPAAQQIEFLRRLEEKITYYQALHDNTDLWISLDNGPVSGDSVFPLSLDMLP
ncbi:vWA domain-containing protein [Thiolapillus sp.]|uniref:vWA domain-containing protein n=1 Tax=Thiolapillus sp. TaxID=2017437 RepID=UPI003AF6087E